MIAVRNIGDSETTVAATVPYSKQNGDTGTIALPQISLAPGEIKLLNTSNPQLRRNDFATAGLEIKYTGAPGSVIATASSVSRSGNHVFALPMKDPKGGLSSTGGYPWFIKESSSTVVFIKNVTDEPQQFMLSIVYPGGQWGSKIRTIKPGQTFALDVRKLRDSQEKGSDGNVIPLDVTSGHVSWSFRGKRDKVLIGRAQTVDFNNGLASTYECQCPCGWSYLEGRMIPNYVTAFPGDVITYLAQSHQMDCAGNDRGWWDIDPDFFFSSSSSNPEVADWTGGGTATAFAPGTATLGVTWIDRVERLETTVDEHGEVHMECVPEDVIADSSANCDVEPPCAFPVNFHQTGVTDLGDGVLKFEYAWDSSTGNLADLANCMVGEITTYPGSNNPFTWPSPPYVSNSGTPNPTTREVNGNLGAAPDTHVHKSFQTPYTFATFTATQYYRYKCPCKNGGAYVNLVGPIEIVRTVQLAPFVNWTYQLKKSGSIASVTLP